MRRRAIALGLMLLLLSACAATSRRGEAITGEPFHPASEAEARGEQVFMRHCSQCHPGGEGGLGPTLNDKPLPGFAVRLQVRLGVGAMPAFPPNKLSDAELDDLIAYMKAIRAVEPRPDRLREPVSSPRSGP